MYKIKWPFCLHCAVHIEDSTDTVVTKSFRVCLPCVLCKDCLLGWFSQRGRSLSYRMQSGCWTDLPLMQTVSWGFTGRAFNVWSFDRILNRSVHPFCTGRRKNCGPSFRSSTSLLSISCWPFLDLAACLPWSPLTPLSFTVQFQFPCSSHYFTGQLV
jgi:hypothetical protein